MNAFIENKIYNLSKRSRSYVCINAFCIPDCFFSKNTLLFYSSLERILNFKCKKKNVCFIH